MREDVTDFMKNVGELGNRRNRSRSCRQYSELEPTSDQDQDDDYNETPSFHDSETEKELSIALTPAKATKTTPEKISKTSSNFDLIYIHFAITVAS